MRARNYWFSLSFANLVFLRAWTDLIPASPAESFLRKTLAGYGLYAAVVCDVLLFSLLTFAVVTIAPKLPGWLRRVLPAAGILILTLSVASVAFAGGSGLGIEGVLLGAVGITLAVLAMVFPVQAAKPGRGLIVAATPCLAITLLLTPFYLSRQQPLPLDPPLAARLPGTPAVRLLWILYDDWDWRLTFPDRPTDITLPSIDRLAGRSFNAADARAVQAGRTPVSEMATVSAVPSLLYGRVVLGEETQDASTMRLEFAPSSSAPLGEEGSVVLGSGNSVFARARAHGWNAAAAGWHLPYCRVFAAQLTDCYWDVRYIPLYAARTDFAGGAVDEARMLFETSSFSPFGPSLLNARHRGEFDALLAAGRRYAADPSIGLALIHLNVPHAPYFYDPKIGPSFRYSRWTALYSEGLQWVDRSLGEIVGALRASGLDGKTALIVSSDHPFRFSAAQDPRVPFLVRLPGDDTGLIWNEEFSAVLSADLAMAIMRGEVNTAVDVAKFVRARRWQL